ncbi:hypothetical protein V6N11_005118 [Hibiscus sabdariffa]|uniref:RNase H type-1 domain-containing protein n=1 Tax=Hibiscus sabdariffa TaxID=183260 RepID=A0ABR2RMB2_9ROSI
MTSDSSCPVCACPVEDLHHLLRACPVASSIWRRCIRPDRLDVFMRMEIKDWILVNLSTGGGFVLDIADWDVLFGLILWNLWLRRNAVAFCVINESHESVFEASLRLQRECLVAPGRVWLPIYGSGVATAVSRVNRLAVRWRRPPEEWCKLNCDEAVVTSSGYSTCGGVIRNAAGDWLIGFSRKLGICSVIESELWGIYEGLLVAWSLGLVRLIVEVDSSNAINLIRQYKEGQAALALVPNIVSLINRRRSIELSHVMRKGNKLADCMAKFSNWDDLFCHRFLSSRGMMVFQLEEDSHDSSLAGG